MTADYIVIAIMSFASGWAVCWVWGWITDIRSYWKIGKKGVSYLASNPTVKQTIANIKSRKKTYVRDDDDNFILFELDVPSEEEDLWEGTDLQK